jgi:hypothetical protein
MTILTMSYSYNHVIPHSSIHLDSLYLQMSVIYKGACLQRCVLATQDPDFNHLIDSLSMYSPSAIIWCRPATNLTWIFPPLKRNPACPTTIQIFLTSSFFC